MTVRSNYRWLTSGLATVILIIILVSTVLLWPVPYLGFGVDFPTATVAFVEPGTSAAQAGLQAGDHILRLYGRPWNEVVSHPNLLALIGPPERPVLISIERMGVVHTFALAQGAPDTATQVGKAVEALLALLCWLTGYLLGFIRRHEASSSPLVACFWLSVGGLLGSYAFARNLSFPLMLVSQWLLLTVLVPLMIYTHVRFPARPISRQQAHVAWWGLVGAWVLLNSGLVGTVIIWRPTLAQLLNTLSNILPLAVLFGLTASGVILRRAYRQVRIAHVRRQIRLIVLACVFVICAWLLLLVLPQLISGQPLITDYWIDLISGAVPLAYLVGGIVPDLYRIDRIGLRLVLHVGTMTILAGILVAITMVFDVRGTTAILWMTLCFVVLYRPVQHFGFRLLPAHINPTRNSYYALHSAATRLTTTLDASVLVDAVCAGVRATFDAPAMAFYLGDIDGSNLLTRVVQERLPNLPTTIASGELTDQLCRLAPVTESRMLYTALAEISPTAGEEALRHPAVALWCPIRHAQGYLLGLLLLGMRSDLDSYRAQDIRELQRLLEAAALAFGHSATYVHQCEVEMTVRQLYQRLQIAEETKAAAIARELHDEVINVNVRLNIETLQKLLTQVDDPTIRPDLDLLLESERTEAHLLRMICEDLHPTGLDDPLGLPALLRMLVDRTHARWSGTCHLAIEHTPYPIAAPTQREVLGIATEALNNIIKHAMATEAVVQLCYADTLDGQVQFIIRDNGRTRQPITARPGHWGVRSMYERARTIGGTLQLCCEPDGGTAVIVAFPP